MSQNSMLVSVSVSQNVLMIACLSQENVKICTSLVYEKTLIYYIGSFGFDTLFLGLSLETETKLKSQYRLDRDQNWAYTIAVKHRFNGRVARTSEK